MVGSRVTRNYFTLFGIAPAHGRTFTKDEDQPGRTNVVVLSHRLVAAPIRRRSGHRRPVRSASTANRTTSSASCRRSSIRSATPPKRGSRSASRPNSSRMYDEFYLNAYARQRTGCLAGSKSTTNSSRVAQSARRSIIRTSIASAAPTSTAELVLRRRLPAAPVHPARRGGARPADRVRQRRQPSARAARGAHRASSRSARPSAPDAAASSGRC